MASTGTIFLIFTAFMGIADANAFVKVVCEPQTTGRLGQPSLLDCVVQLMEGLSDVDISMVLWEREDDEKNVLTFHQDQMKAEPGYRLAEASWDERNMNVSLLVANTTLADAGAYTCTVVTNSGDGKSTARLTVTAQYNKPVIRSIPEKITENSDATLKCDSDGGYPAGRIRWFDGDLKDWTKSSKMDVQEAPSGLFHLSSELSLLRGSIYSKYTCVVYNASGDKEAETVFEVGDQPMGHVGQTGSDASKIVAPVVVIGSLIVGLLLVLLAWKRCRPWTHRPVNQDERDAEEGGFELGNLQERDKDHPEETQN